MRTRFAQIAVLTLVTTTALCLRPPAARADVICVGDCNGDGHVAVNEIIGMVNITLGILQPSTCPNGIPSGMQVNVALIISAINNVLNGCPVVATPTPTPTPTQTPAETPGALPPAEAVAGQTTIAINTVTLISDVVGALANGFQFSSLTAPDMSAFTAAGAPGGQGAGSCPLGGTATSSGNPVTGQTFTLTGCTAATADGSVTFDGSGTIGALSGLSINVQMTFKDQMGTVIETVNANLTGPTPSVSLGGSCYLTAATLTVSGTLTRTIGGQTLGVTFTNTTLKVDQVTFNASCVPTLYDVTLNGTAALVDPSGTSQDVAFNQLVILVDSTGTPTRFSINGGIDSTCFGGTVMLTTQSQLTIPSGETCPTAGMITAVTGQGQAAITFQSDGSVTIDAGAGGTLTAPNCLDPRLLMCVA